MERQTLQSQIGEIEFRKKLLRQQIQGEPLFNDEFDSEGIINVLADRMSETLRQMMLLKQRGLTLSPYIEIGAERCQRSLVMENDVGASGAAIDISYHMLRSCDYYKDVFNKAKFPLRICCDANHLPFMTASVPFVFCYETLHHFPDPAPVLAEIYRVLSPGGYFFFDNEPYKKVLHLNLYKGKNEFLKHSSKAGIFRKGIDYFFSKKNFNELNYGIIENLNISVREWQEALSLFEEKEVRLRSLNTFDSELFNPKHSVKTFFVRLLGGKISGLCRKSGAPSAQSTPPIQELLICPSCFENRRESKLIRTELPFFCNDCGSSFRFMNDVVFLLSRKKLEELYPELLQESHVHADLPPSILSKS